MPNNSKARRDRSEKKKNKDRVPTPPEKQVPAEGVAWDLFSLVPSQIQDSRKMMIVSHGKQ
jgi:hypothetical protein